MSKLIVVFILTTLSGLISVTGGNGIALMPLLLIMHYNLIDILLLVRTSAVVFVLFNFFAVVRSKSVPKTDSRDLLITAISCVSILFSITFMSKLNQPSLMFTIIVMLICLVIFLLFKPKKNKNPWIYILILPIFAGICGSTIGGAGLVISVLYTILGMDVVTACKKRIIPSLIIQIVAFSMFLSKDFSVNYNLLFAVLLASAIAGYLNMKIFMKLSPRSGKILFYGSIIFSILNLLEDIIFHQLKILPLGYMFYHKWLMNF